MMESDMVYFAILMMVLVGAFAKIGMAADTVRFLEGVTYEYYEGDWEEMPNFNQLTASKSGKLDAIDLDARERDENFAIQFAGSVEIPVDGKYTFFIKSSNMCKIYVDDQLILRHTAGKKAASNEILYPLTKGKHSVLINYLYRSGHRVLDVQCNGPEFYQFDKKQWLYFGWQNDHPKSLSFMGGTLSAGRTKTIQYVLDIDGRTYFPNEFDVNRIKKIKWHLSDGYMPSPISGWEAGEINVKIQHFARRIMDDKATAVFTRVGLVNKGPKKKKVQLRMNTGQDDVICLNGKAETIDNFHSVYTAIIQSGKNIELDFMCLANGDISIQDINDPGDFDTNYKQMSEYYEQRINGLAHPVALPNDAIVELYKSAQIVMWESVVQVENGDLEMRGSGGNIAGYYQYDRTFSHDVPNMVAQFIREGDFELAKGIMESSYYQLLGKELEQNYLDAIPKFIIPYALYLQFAGDKKYFTTKVRKNIKNAAHLIHKYRDFDTDEFHMGIMGKSNTLDNGSDYLIVDNFAALHGLAAYKFICKYFNDVEEAKWAEEELKDLNIAFNKALKHTMERRGVNWYMAALDDDSYFWKRGYDGNWHGTSFMMSTFPWDAYLQGFDLGGTWKDHFDQTIDNAIHLRDISPYNIPPRSWGAWWTHEYGACYNAGMGLQLLFSEKHRTEGINNLEFLVDNQSAPYQWGESFDPGLTKYDWTRSAADLETWGLGFDKQALLEACVSIKTNGEIIIGRGIPVHWSKPGDVIEWENVPINNGKKISFTIEFNKKDVKFSKSGDSPESNIILNLPILVKNIAQVNVDQKTDTSFNDDLGKIVLPSNAAEVEVVLKKLN